MTDWTYFDFLQVQEVQGMDCLTTEPGSFLASSSIEVSRGRQVITVPAGKVGRGIHDAPTVRRSLGSTASSSINQSINQ